MTCKPDFVPGPLARRPSMTIPLVPPLPTGSSCQPGPLGSKFPAGGRLPDQPRARPLFGVAPGGACRAGPVTSPAVGSYPTVSPLPAANGGRFHFCGAFPRVTPAGRYPAPFLHGVRTFLARPGFRERTHERTRSSGHPRQGDISLRNAWVNGHHPASRAAWWAVDEYLGQKKAKELFRAFFWSKYSGGEARIPRRGGSAPCPGCG